MHDLPDFQVYVYLFWERLNNTTQMICLVARNWLIALLVLRCPHVLILFICTLVRVLVLQATALDEMLRKFKFYIWIRSLDVLQRHLSNAGSPFLALEVRHSRSDLVRSIFYLPQKFHDVPTPNVMRDEVALKKAHGHGVAEVLAEEVIAQTVMILCIESETGDELGGVSNLVKDNDAISVLIRKLLVSYEVNDAERWRRLTSTSTLIALASQSR